MPPPPIIIQRPFPAPWPASSTLSMEENNAHALAWLEAFRAFDEDTSFEGMVAPIESVAREYLRKAGLPFDPGLSYVLRDPQDPRWWWEGTLEFLMQHWYGGKSAQFCAGNILRLIYQIRHLLAQQGPAESVWRLTVHLMLTREYATNTRLCILRGRRKGPDGFEDDQEFEAVVVYLIQCAHNKGQGTKQKRIATLLGPALKRRRGGIDSAASVDIDIASTIRLIQKHTSCPWHDLVKKALATL